MTKITGTLYDDVCTFMKYLAIFLEWKNTLDESCTENRNTHFIFHNSLPKILPFMRQCGKIS
jgi:hypothetical protein